MSEIVFVCRRGENAPSMEEVEGNVLEAVDVERELTPKHAPEVEDVSAFDLKERVLLAVVLRGGSSSRIE